MSVPGGRVRVVRSGGVAGMRLEREVDLDGLDDSARAAWRRLLDSPAVRRPAEPGRARPDGFGYRIVSAPDGLDVTIPEQQLPADHLRLLEAVLRR